MRFCHTCFAKQDHCFTFTRMPRTGRRYAGPARVWCILQICMERKHAEAKPKVGAAHRLIDSLNIQIRVDWTCQVLLLFAWSFYNIEGIQKYNHGIGHTNATADVSINTSSALSSLCHDLHFYVSTFHVGCSLTLGFKFGIVNTIIVISHTWYFIELTSKINQSLLIVHETFENHISHSLLRSIHVIFTVKEHGMIYLNVKRA